MKNMKKLIALLLALCVVFTLAACGGRSDDDDDERTPRSAHKRSEDSVSPGNGIVPGRDDNKVEPAAPAAQTVTIHASVPSSWGSPICAWAWNGNDNAFDAWPGEPMTQNGYWYEITVPDWTNSFIVNGNGGSVQTADLDIEPGREAWIVVNSDGRALVYYEDPFVYQGNPRLPDFVSYGLDHFVPFMDTASFVTECMDDSSKETTGYFTVMADETSPRDDGMEDRHICFLVSFSDSNAEKYKPVFFFIFEDYYDSKLMNDTMVDYGDRCYSYDVFWNGEQQTVYFAYAHSETGWINHSNTEQYDFYYTVPEGYDGIVLGVTRPLYGVTSDYIYDYATDETLFYRAD